MIYKFKQNILAFVDRHKKIKYWLMVILRSGNSEWVSDVIHVWNSWNSVTAKHKGEKNKGEILYDIQYAGEAGFMCTVLSVLYNLWYADRFHMKPIVTAHNVLYEEEEPVNGATQFWEYYFKPCSEFSVDDLKSSFTVVPYKRKNYAELAQIWGQYEEEKYRLSEEAINDLGRIYGKYVSLNDTMSCKIKGDIRNLLNGKRTLGVHIRRGDMLANLDHHPIPPEINDFIEATNCALNSCDFEQIFLATSDKKSVEEFRKVYGSKMVTYSDIVRTEGIQTVYETEDTRKNRKYMSGVDVLRDAYTLATCDGFIACLSNVSAVAKIIKVASGKKFEYLYTVDKGINHNSTSVYTINKKIFRNIKRMEKQNKL